MVFSTKIRVYYEDTDAGGVVYHANYLRFLERCRSDWLIHHGWPVDRVARECGAAFIVTAIDARYLSPARLMDTLTVTSEIVETKRVQCKAQQNVFRGDELLFQATVSLACVNVSTQRPCAIPDPLKPFFQQKKL
jgi:acyl-CoA thioester hydrolase